MDGRVQRIVFCKNKETWEKNEITWPPAYITALADLRPKHQHGTASWSSCGLAIIIIDSDSFSHWWKFSRKPGSSSTNTKAALAIVLNTRPGLLRRPRLYYLTQVGHLFFVRPTVFDKYLPLPRPGFVTRSPTTRFRPGFQVTPRVSVDGQGMQMQSLHSIELYWSDGYRLSGSPSPRGKLTLISCWVLHITILSLLSPALNLLSAVLRLPRNLVLITLITNYPLFERDRWPIPDFVIITPAGWFPSVLIYLAHYVLWRVRRNLVILSLPQDELKSITKCSFDDFLHRI